MDKPNADLVAVGVILLQVGGSLRSWRYSLALMGVFAALTLVLPLVVVVLATLAVVLSRPRSGSRGYSLLPKKRA